MVEDFNKKSKVFYCKGNTICLFCSLCDGRRTTYTTGVVHIVLRLSYDVYDGCRTMSNMAKTEEQKSVVTFLIRLNEAYLSA